MLSWTIGAVKVTRIVELEMPVPYSTSRPFLVEATPQALREHAWLFPDFVTEEGHLRFSVHALLVEAPGMRLVVDTCVGNDRPRGMTGGVPLATGFLNLFADAGWTRESVDAVVCTHLHVDHVGWNTMLVDGAWAPTFPNARYLIGRAEYEHWRTQEGEAQQILADSVQPIFDAGLAELVDMDHQISPELRLVPTPGHTPGHVSVAIESAGERGLITGDFTHHPCQMAHPEWSPVFDADPQSAAVLRRRMFDDLADQPVLVIGTHFAAPTAGHVKRDGDAFRFEVEVKSGHAPTPCS